METITEHVVNPANDRLKIEVVDDPGHGGACHAYLIRGFDSRTNATAPEHIHAQGDEIVILFQNGPIAEGGVGVNGVTHEALLAILAHRLRGFQAGPYACRENALALTKIEEAQHWLQHRTRARMARGVEGTHAV